MSEVLVYALHGFLGSGQDWRNVQSDLPTHVRFKADSFFAPGFENFHFALEATVKKIFVGYSLGGRLGLKILNKDPGEFDHYIFLSAHPGLPDADSNARNLRAAHDLRWAERITTENWDTFLAEWNEQNVFRDAKQDSAHNFPRLIHQYDLQLLRRSLIDDSLARQPDYRELIRKNQDRITWVVGSEDKKFRSIAEEMQTSRVLKAVTRIESGHRVLIDNPRAVAQIITSILPARL